MKGLGRRPDHLPAGNLLPFAGSRVGAGVVTLLTTQAPTKVHTLTPGLDLRPGEAFGLIQIERGMIVQGSGLLTRVWVGEGRKRG